VGAGEGGGWRSGGRGWKERGGENRRAGSKQGARCSPTLSSTRMMGWGGMGHLDVGREDPAHEHDEAVEPVPRRRKVALQRRQEGGAG
jgi:hypothetical protein